VKKSVFVEIVRLLIVLLFTAGGYAVAAEYEAALMGTIFGAAVGYVCGGILGRFLRKMLGIVEAETTRLSAGEILAGSIGALVMGLLGALVGVTAIGLLPDPWGWPVFGLIVWMGVHLGFRIAWRKSSEMLSMAGLSERSLGNLTASPTRDAVLIDTCTATCSCPALFSTSYRASQTREIRRYEERGGSVSNLSKPSNATLVCVFTYRRRRFRKSRRSTRNSSPWRHAFP